MNWTWSIRSRDGGRNGLEFSQSTTASDFTRALVHAAPAQMTVTIRTDGGELVAESDVDRDGEYSPMTLLEIDGRSVRRREVWPTEEHHGMLVLLAGGEAGVLQRWQHADDQTSWRWTIEFSNHQGRPADWAPDDQQLNR